MHNFLRTSQKTVLDVNNDNVEVCCLGNIPAQTLQTIEANAIPKRPHTLKIVHYNPCVCCFIVSMNLIAPVLAYAFQPGLLDQATNHQRAIFIQQVEGTASAYTHVLSTNLISTAGADTL